MFGPSQTSKGYNDFLNVLLIKHSFISYCKDESKKPFKYSVNVYCSNTKTFNFLFLSESKMKKFVNSFNKINNIEENKFEKEYQVIVELSKGHFGRIFKVENKTTQKIYVEKRIHKKIPYIKEIEWEIYISQYLSTYHHENIVNIVDVIISHDVVHIIMDYIPNGSFDKQFLLFPTSSYPQYLGQIISGIHFLHKYGIMHRDIKLENIVYNEKSKNLKIIDFGLSKVLFPSETTSECCGTVSYTAPEIFENKPYNSKIDIWSFGIIAYILEFKKLPFESKEFNREVINKQLSHFFRVNNEKDFTYWEESLLKKIIHLSLVKIPNQRCTASVIIDLLFSKEKENNNK